MAGIEPVEQSGPRPAYVQYAGRRWSEAGDDGHGFVRARGLLKCRTVTRCSISGTGIQQG